MNSVSNECQELKTIYDSCFNQWYTEKFLKGESEDTTCELLYSKYQDCVKNAIKRLNINIPKIEYPDDKKDE